MHALVEDDLLDEDCVGQQVGHVGDDLQRVNHVFANYCPFFLINSHVRLPVIKKVQIENAVESLFLADVCRATF